ncbi:uncharacterized protein LOC34624657 [Cyclospora cayetanensis]|uniref:Uncharacterized protein LOC34624657 n=1 Tax=Cyclospora cayetanensis TaxID=88456 RepID=A0A6P6S358_9EIME|nr:uncharacterized protein LOC34624657 [Cyclospora cayetanensis]
MEAALLALALEELALHPFPGASFERLCLDLQDEHQLELDVFMRALLWRSLYRSPEVFFTDAASCGLHQVPPSRVSSTPSGADQERVEDRRLDWRDPAIPPELPVAPSVPCRLAELSNQAATTAHEAEAHASKGSRLLGSSCTTVEAAGDPSLEQQRRWLLVASGGIALRLLTAMDMSNDRNEFEHRVSEVHFQVLRNVARHKEHGERASGSLPPAKQLALMPGPWTAEKLSLLQLNKSAGLMGRVDRGTYLALRAACQAIFSHVSETTLDELKDIFVEWAASPHPEAVRLASSIALSLGAAAPHVLVPRLLELTEKRLLDFSASEEATRREGTVAVYGVSFPAVHLRAAVSWEAVDWLMRLLAASIRGAGSLGVGRPPEASAVHSALGGPLLDREGGGGDRVARAFSRGACSGAAVCSEVLAAAAAFSQERDAAAAANWSPALGSLAELRRLPPDFLGPLTEDETAAPAAAAAAAGGGAPCPSHAAGGQQLLEESEARTTRARLARALKICRLLSKAAAAQQADERPRRIPMWGVVTPYEAVPPEAPLVSPPNNTPPTPHNSDVGRGSRASASPFRAAPLVEAVASLLLVVAQTQVPMPDGPLLPHRGASEPATAAAQAAAGGGSGKSRKEGAMDTGEEAKMLIRFLKVSRQLLLRPFTAWVYDAGRINKENGGTPSCGFEVEGVEVLSSCYGMLKCMLVTLHALAAARGGNPTSTGVVAASLPFFYTQRYLPSLRAYPHTPFSS